MPARCVGEQRRGVCRASEEPPVRRSAPWSHARGVGAVPPDPQVPIPDEHRRWRAWTRNASPGCRRRVVFSRIAGAGPELPARPQYSAHDSEVTPGAAATPRCRRQGGNAYGELRGSGEAGLPGPGRLQVVSGPGGVLFRAPDARGVGDLAGERAGKEGGEDCSLSLGRGEQRSCCSRGI